MTTEVRVPQLPESVADATLVTWHKQVGDAVARDENLADLETDKVVLELPAPVAGVLNAGQAAGSTVTRRELLAVIDERAAAAPAEASSKSERRAADAKKAAAAPARNARARQPASCRRPRRLVEENQLAPGQIAGAARRPHHERRRGSAPRSQPGTGARRRAHAWTGACRCRGCAPASRSAWSRRRRPRRCSRRSSKSTYRR
jgi:pyruvate/2-oxoglutarate dehydrogenase complex dihydrolipoamide acyltransferase (E2) component